MYYDKNDFAINIQGVWNRPVTAHLRNDSAAWDAPPQLGLQHRPAARPRISPGGVVHGVRSGSCWSVPLPLLPAASKRRTGDRYGDHRCRVRGMTDEEALAGIDDLGVIAQVTPSTKCAWSTAPAPSDQGAAAMMTFQLASTAQPAAPHPHSHPPVTAPAHGKPENDRLGRFSGGRELAAAGPGACLAPAGSGRS